MIKILEYINSLKSEIKLIKLEIKDLESSISSLNVTQTKIQSSNHTSIVESGVIKIEQLQKKLQQLEYKLQYAMELINLTNISFYNFKLFEGQLIAQLLLEGKTEYSIISKLSLNKSRYTLYLKEFENYFFSRMNNLK